MHDERLDVLPCNIGGLFLGGQDDVLVMSYSRLMSRLEQVFTMIVLDVN